MDTISIVKFAKGRNSVKNVGGVMVLVMVLVGKVSVTLVVNHTTTLSRGFRVAISHRFLNHRSISLSTRTRFLIRLLNW